MVHQRHMVILSNRPSFTGNGKVDRYDYMWLGWRKGLDTTRCWMRWIQNPAKAVRNGA